MSVITFYTSCKEEAGNTVSALSFATYSGITENKKTLIISTGLNDTTMTDSLWPIQRKRISGLFGPNTSVISQNGMEDIDRMVRANRLTPEVMQNYTRVALKGRLELLNGYKGTEEQYIDIQRNYAQIITLASKAYDNVIVDLDKTLNKQVKTQVLNVSDIVVALTSQKFSNVKELVEKIENNDTFRSDNTIFAIGKYNDRTKYNIKNISRSLLKKTETINTIPYNSLIFEATQEGKVIDVFWKFLNLKIKDENTFFIDELKRLKEEVDKKIKNIQMRR